MILTQAFSILHPPSSHNQREKMNENHHGASRRHWWHLYNSKTLWTIACLKQLPSKLTSQKGKTKTKKENKEPQTINLQIIVSKSIRLQQVTFFPLSTLKIPNTLRHTKWEMIKECLQTCLWHYHFINKKLIDSSFSLKAETLWTINFKTRLG